MGFFRAGAFVASIIGGGGVTASYAVFYCSAV